MQAKLKLINNAQPVKQQRGIVGIVHRCSQRAEDRTRNLTRRYSSMENAFTRMTNFMLQNGYVGDVCEIVHYNTGLQLGTIKMTATGHIKLWLNLEGK